jgi:uncharacterized protein (DUF58 family)
VPTLLPPDELLRRLDLAVSRRMSGMASGDAPAIGTQGGMELERIRAWTPGDDWRMLDAAATARTGTPHVKVPVAERRLTVWLGIDVSSSMAFGTQHLEKFELARAAAATFGLLGLRQSAQVGGLALGDGSEAPQPPRAGRAQLLSLLERIDVRRDDFPGDFVAALTRLERCGRDRCFVVVVSDFRDPDTASWQAPLARLALRHELVCVEVRDRREDELPDVGVTRFVDPETGRTYTVDTSSASLRDRFAERAAQRRAAVADAVASTGADLLSVSTGSDWFESLMLHIDRRRRRRWVSAAR